MAPLPLTSTPTTLTPSPHHPSSTHLTLSFQVPDDLLVDRVVGRRSDPATGEIYHLTFKPPPPEALPRLVQRSDDTEEKVRNRLATYHRNVDAVLGYYTGQLVEVRVFLCLRERVLSYGGERAGGGGWVDSGGCWARAQGGMNSTLLGIQGLSGGASACSTSCTDRACPLPGRAD